MKYQTNAVGHWVGASELPTRHPRHKLRRHVPLLLLSRSSKLLQDISLSPALTPIADISIFPLLLTLSFSSSYSSFPSTSYISLPHPSTSSLFFMFLFLVPHRAMFTFLFNVFFFLPENNELENSRLHTCRRLVAFYTDGI